MTKYGSQNGGGQHWLPAVNNTENFTRERALIHCPVVGYENIHLLNIPKQDQLTIAFEDSNVQNSSAIVESKGEIGRAHV